MERGLIVHMLPTSTMALDEDGRTVGQRSPSLVSLQAMLMQGRAWCYEHLTNQEHSALPPAVPTVLAAGTEEERRASGRCANPQQSCRVCQASKALSGV